MITHRNFSLTSVALSLLLLLILSACGDVTPTATSTTAVITTTTTVAATTTTAPTTTTTVAPTTAITTTNTVATTTQATTTVAPTTASITTDPVALSMTTAVPTITINSGSSYKIVVGKSDGSIQLFKSPQDFTNTKAPIIGQGNSPIFSPDGKRIAFIAINNSGDPASNSPIQTVKLDGTDLQTYCTISYQHTNLIRWLPKLNYIIFGLLSIGVNTSSSCDLNDKSAKDSPVGSADSVGAVLDYAPDGKSFV